MGVRILEGTYDGTRDAAVLVDSVTGTAFGPLFADHDEAEAFLKWLEGAETWPDRCSPDPRRIPVVQLAWLLQRYREERAA